MSAALKRMLPRAGAGMEDHAGQRGAGGIRRVRDIRGRAFGNATRRFRPCCGIAVFERLTAATHSPLM